MNKWLIQNVTDVVARPTHYHHNSQVIIMCEVQKESNRLRSHWLEVFYKLMKIKIY